MTKNEIVLKNISLSFDFIRYLLQHPDLLAGMPENADIEFIERDLPCPAAGAPASDSTPMVLFSVEHTFREISLEE